MSCLVSILLPLYNESVEYATLAIDSLCNQTYTELEIILLLDNPQNKRLLSLLKEYTQRDNRIVLYINEKNMGLPTLFKSKIFHILNLLVNIINDHRIHT